MSAAPEAFLARPHRTLLGLAFPVLLSLIAEPVAALVDTAFVRSLGAGPLAAVGVGGALLSGVFWIFNFLGVATQSEVAQSAGAADPEGSRRAVGLALTWALVLGLGIALLGWLTGPAAVTAMEAEGAVHADAVTYLHIRLLAAPAVLLIVASFGALRGALDMRAPLVVAVVAHGLNVLLDWLLIFGVGPFPAMGVAGAAWATVASQWLAAAMALTMLVRRLGLPVRAPLREGRALLRIGGDLFVRTGLLTVFLVLGTRAATSIGAEAGAAHHAIRSVWLFTALVLDAIAVSAQSLVGGFFGAGAVAAARRVAAVSCGWGLLAGALIAAAMLAAQDAVAAWLVPPEAWPLFAAAWLPAALAQPLNAVSFVTDGLHWGTRDYAFLRNAMAAAFVAGAGLLLALDLGRPGALTAVWWVTGLWITVRAGFGLARVWPGLGNSPWRG